ncbi:DUF5807 family protein [Halospeciosus flavus]|uniref:DUF5807 family protein n=1 Tax=Halospeciosus flavus TaxID=3032283 RepID=A0ABD5Z6U7_9EURY|nr:DUF5807 family protein [Halospeciosus flavus]
MNVSERFQSFLSGERPDDVAVFLSEDVVGDLGPLAEYGEETDDGIVLVVDGEKGRSVFQQVTGVEAMQFAQSAMDTDGDIDDDLSGGECPARPEVEDESEHGVRYVFAFAEEQNEEVGGLYAEGPVVHAYAYCDCGEAYSDRWVVEE